MAFDFDGALAATDMTVALAAAGQLLDDGPADALDAVATAAGVGLAETLAVGGRAWPLPMRQAAEDAGGSHPGAVVEEYGLF